jgi:predicted RNase H-like HicB family nuclease
MFVGRFEEFVAFGETPEEIMESLERSMLNDGLDSNDFPMPSDVEFFQCRPAGVVHKGWEFVIQHEYD